MTTFFGKPETRWAREMGFSWTRKIPREKDKVVKKELVDSRVEDTIVYNDLNDDKKALLHPPTGLPYSAAALPRPQPTECFLGV